MFYRFRFKKESIGDDTIYRPKIGITLSNNGKNKEVIAVLDTGSDLVYIPRDMADYFELVLSKKKEEAQGVGQTIEYRTATITLRIEHPHHAYQKKVQVIVPETDVHKDIILGTEFLQDFIVTLDYPKRIIKLTEKTQNK